MYSFKYSFKYSPKSSSPYSSQLKRSALTGVTVGAMLLLAACGQTVKLTDLPPVVDRSGAGGLGNMGGIGNIANTISESPSNMGSNSSGVNASSSQGSASSTGTSANTSASTNASASGINMGAANSAANATANGTANGISGSSTAITSVQARDTSSTQPDAGLLAQRSVFFDYDSFTIRPEAQPILQAHAKNLAANRGRKVTLEGNTDERGGREYNLALGQKRAQAVAQALAVLGVVESQMEPVSFGNEKPKATGSSEADYAQNRRVDLNYR